MRSPSGFLSLIRLLGYEFQLSQRVLNFDNGKGGVGACPEEEQ